MTSAKGQSCPEVTQESDAGSAHLGAMEAGGEAWSSFLSLSFFHSQNTLLPGEFYGTKD